MAPVLSAIRWSSVGLAVALDFLPLCGAAAVAPRSAGEERMSFQLADTTLTIQLVAAEPDVISPVALAWGANAELYVAEMRDYPNATEGGTIRLLTGLDSNGRYQKSRLFADRLHFPNSVLPWNGGVLVTAAPDLVFLKDNDGDGVADERRVLFTGFGTGNQQLRANGLQWGPDGWVYGANGRSDGAVHRVGDTNLYSLRGRDFRFRPWTGEFETLAGRSQFGLALDDWGHRFLSWNTIPIRHEVFPDGYFARNPNFPAAEVIADLMPPGDAGQIFPLTPPPLVFNNESSSHFNALAGLTIYRGDALGFAYTGNAFVGESLRNLVHRRILDPNGPTFWASRGEHEAQVEFLRSRDPWFHPVNFATGPDGALYIADFYRQFVEHPDFVPREMRAAISWRTGGERGRIWRVYRREKRPHPAQAVLRPALVPSRSLAQLLDHPNAWQRDTAFRLLLERRDSAAFEPLQRLAQSARRPVTRALSLRLLALFGALPARMELSALADSDAQVRETALQVTEFRMAAAPPAENLVNGVTQLTADPSDRVRLQAALTLGTLKDDGPREAAVNRVLERETNRWIRLAALTGSRTRTREQLIQLLPSSPHPLRPAPILAPADPDRLRVVEQYAPALKLTGDLKRGAATFGKLCLACHYLQGHGQRVGPDLSGIASRPAEALLIDVLDPSRQVVPEYAAYEVQLKSGETMIGLFASETDTRITLRRPGSPDENFPRTQVQALRPTGKSLMPDGLESGLTQADLADLLAFLQRPDGSLLPP